MTLSIYSNKNKFTTDIKLTKSARYLAIRAVFIEQVKGYKNGDKSQMLDNFYWYFRHVKMGPSFNLIQWRHF